MIMFYYGRTQVETGVEGKRLCNRHSWAGSQPRLFRKYRSDSGDDKWWLRRWQQTVKDKPQSGINTQNKSNQGNSGQQGTFKGPGTNKNGDRGHTVTNKLLIFIPDKTNLNLNNSAVFNKLMTVSWWQWASFMNWG